MNGRRRRFRRRALPPVPQVPFDQVLDDLRRRLPGLDRRQQQLLAPLRIQVHAEPGTRNVTDLSDDGTAGDDLPSGVRGKRHASWKEREAAKAEGCTVPD